MQKFLKITQQAFWQVVVKLITTISGFIILGIISRTYGEAGTGNFTLALTFLAFFYILADFGFNAEILRRGKMEEINELLGVRLVWSVFLILTAVIIAFILPFSYPIDFKWAVLLGSSIILFYSINQTAQVVFQKNQRYDLDIAPTFVGVLVCTLLIFWFALFGLPVYFALLGYTIAWFIHAFGSFFLAANFLKKTLPVFDFSYFKNLFKDTWPIAGTLFLNVIYFRSDAFILQYFHSSFDVGIYNVAYSVFQAILVLPTFIMNSFYPMMIETLKSKSEQFGKQIKSAALGLFIISVFILLITYFLSSFAIKLITGSGFSGSVASLQILTFGLPAYFLSALLMWVMVTKKMYKSLLIVYALGLMVNITANLVYIPQYSYIASSWITGISEYLILFMQIMILWLL